MDVVLGIALLIAFVFGYYWFRRGVSKAIGVGLNKTVFRTGVQRRNEFIETSLLFKPSRMTDPDEIYAAARKAIPFRSAASIAGVSVTLVGEHSNLAYVKLRNVVAGDVGSVAISVEQFNGEPHARFTVAEWLISDGDPRSGHFEKLQSEWLTALRRADPGGSVIRRSTKSLPQPGASLPRAVNRDKGTTTTTDSDDTARSRLPDLCLSAGEPFVLRDVSGHEIVDTLPRHLAEHRDSALVLDWRGSPTLSPQGISQLTSIVKRILRDGTTPRVLGHRSPQGIIDRFAQMAAENELYFETTPSCFTIQPEPIVQPETESGQSIKAGEHPCESSATTIALGSTLPHMYLGEVRAALDDPESSTLTLHFAGAQLSATNEKAMAHLLAGGLTSGSITQFYLHEPPTSFTATMEDLAIDQSLQDDTFGRCLRISAVGPLTKQVAAAAEPIEASGVVQSAATLDRGAIASPASEERNTPVAPPASTHTPDTRSTGIAGTPSDEGAALAAEGFTSDEDGGEVSDTTRGSDYVETVQGEAAVPTRCPSCAAPSSAGSKFCRTCGTKLIAIKEGNRQAAFCASCGQQFPGQQAFCTRCGKPRRVRPGGTSTGTRSQPSEEPPPATRSSAHVPVAAGPDAETPSDSFPPERAPSIAAKTQSKSESGASDEPQPSPEAAADRLQTVSGIDDMPTAPERRGANAIVAEDTTIGAVSDALPQPSDRVLPRGNPKPSSENTQGNAEDAASASDRRASSCARCFEQIPEDAWFCSHCGHPTART